MRREEVLNKSISILFIRNLSGRFYFLRQRFAVIFEDSLMKKITRSFHHKAVISFRLSIFGRINTAVDKISRLILLNDSLVVQKANIAFAGLNWFISTGFNLSLIRTCLRRDIAELRFLPLRAIGTILVAGSATNILFSLTEWKLIGIGGYGIRVLFILLGVWGIFCPRNFLAMVNDSILLRKVRRLKSVRNLR